MELNREKEYMQEAEDLIRNHRESAPELDVLERVFRLGVWSRGSTLPRGTLFMPAAARLGEDSIAVLLKWLDQNPTAAAGHKVLLAIGQWGGTNCFDAIASAIRNAGRDTSTLLYCISALRLIGGPQGGNFLVDLMKIPDESVQKEAISAVMDLATGGSASDIDSATSVPLSSQQPLEDLLHLRLGQTLDTLRHSTGLPLAVRLKAEGATAWLVRNEFLKPVSDLPEIPEDAPLPWFPGISSAGTDSVIHGAAQRRPVGRLALHSKATPNQRIWAWRPALNAAGGVRGGPQEEKTVYYVPVNLKGGEFRAILTIHPLPAPERADVLVPEIFYLSVNKRIVANIGLREDPLPEKITALRVSAGLGEVEVDAYGDPLILKPGEQRVAEFAIPEDSLHEWCDHPKFVLAPVPTKSAEGGTLRDGDLPAVVYQEPWGMAIYS
jgi:hypothetical protein